MKYLVVTGGVLSGIGKGVIASGTGVLLKALGLKVTSIKIDPYINIDAGTMSPFEHGEVFVLDDGGEVDLDLGNYERFIDSTLTRDNNITTGKIYHYVIEKERRGEYLGKTVQVIPHICEEIQNWISRVAHTPVDGTNELPDICIIELGGTVGDIESMPFIEAIRQFQFKVGKENFCLAHVSLVPVVGVVGEQKTKPTQQSVRELRALGLNPDFILCRSSQPLIQSVKEKISLFCHVPPDRVLSIHDVSNIYKVPLILEKQSFTKLISEVLNISLQNTIINLKDWITISERYDKLNDPSLKPIHIALVGKYTNLSDAYHSIVSSLQHASIKIEERIIIDWIEAEFLQEEIKLTNLNAYNDAWQTLKLANGILVPGGFGNRGFEGKVLAIEYARKQFIPFLGICFGMQIAVVELVRNILGWKDANSTEINPETPYKIVIYMPEISKTHLGGTMRLGKRRTFFKNQDCLSKKLYGNVDFIDERHRHRYEINPEFIEEIEKKTPLRFVGQDETGKRMEIIELDSSVNHPFFIGVQFHPEFLSRPLKPSPLFEGLLLAASGKLQERLTKKII